MCKLCVKKKKKVSEMFFPARLGTVLYYCISRKTEYVDISDNNSASL